MTRSRPSTVVFDVVETLMSLEPLRERMVDVGLHPSTLDRWFDRTLRDGMALTLAGTYVPFPDVAASALAVIGRGTLSRDDVAHVLGGLAELPAQPDAEPAMRTLVDAGIGVACLSNGARKTTVDFLMHTGLARLVGQVISVAEVELWKPPAEVYRYALHRLERSAPEVALVAVHAFDCHGAAAAGLTTGWASRHETVLSNVFSAPDVVGTDLVDVARQLLALPQP